MSIYDIAYTIIGIVDSVGPIVCNAYKNWLTTIIPD